jgi:ankyrin repeat protein
MDFIKNALNLHDIHNAVKDRNQQKVTAILKKNPKVVNTKDKMGYTPLHWAVSEGNTPMVKLLLSRGADANVAENFGYTPLKMATKANHLDIIRLLKGSGARMEIEAPKKPPA